MWLILFLLNWHALAAEKLSWDYADLKTADKSDIQFRFVGDSTKFGLVTTSFTGVALAGELRYEQKEQQLNSVELAVIANRLDTDSSGRNEKMLELCLEAKEHPVIKVKLLAPLDTSLESQTVVAQMTVRGRSAQFPLEIKKTSDKEFKGKGFFSLKSLEIPDPSIAIAKVKDSMRIEFQVKLK